jgi:4-hydroxy-tetrahydrodipicolinate synthase
MIREPVIRDVVPALLTPFREDLEIDEDALQSLADRLAGIDGVGAVFCTGHAGEVAALSADDRKRVVELVAEAVGGRKPVIAGIYTDSLTDAVEMASAARAAGASAVTLFPPPIFADGATLTSEMPFRFFERVAKDGATPVIVFQFPPSSGLGYSTETLLRLAELPQVVAVKEGSSDIGAYERNVRALRNLDSPVPVLTSNNTWLMASLALGGDGILSGSSSVLAPLHVDLWRAMDRGDLMAARSIDERLRPLVEVFYRDPFIDMHTRMKEALVMLGVLPRATVRPPLLPIGKEERDQIRAALQAASLVEA